MIKKYLIIISAVMALTGCVSDSFTGSEELERQANGELPISFGYDVPAATRAENTGADAATALGDQFIVYGEKNETAAAPASGSYVFPNYQVNYTTNTAYTTSSNTRDWEYVGFTHSTNYQNNITTKDGSSAAVTGYDAAQTIKFWDYSATSYTFTAVSASRTSGDPAQTDIERGYVKIQKNTSGATVYDKGYTITTTADADLTKLYLSDRLVINQSAGTDRDAKNAYGGNVTLTFRGGVAQIRVGIYETITGYDISEIKFYVNNTPEPPAAPTQTEEAKVETTSAFGALCPNVKAVGYAGTINVTYSDGSDPANPENRPVITPGESSGLNLILGTNTSTLTKDGETPKFLGTTSTAPTWDTADGAYTPVFPQPGNSTCLTLKCDYTLYNNRTKETIRLTGATTTIPAQYLQWKANYKYTYLFKITENTSGLYPITFDAVEVVEDGGKAEYITTISEPSITTYARGSDVLTNGDYKSGEKIYAVVEDEGSLATLSASNMKLYTVTAPDSKTITPSTVTKALVDGPTMDKAHADNVNQLTPAALNYGNTVVDADGSTKTMHATDNVVADFTGEATAPNNTYYALVYEKTAATYGNDGGHTYADAAAFTAAGTLYTDAACTSEAASWTNASTTYYKKTLTNPGVYGVKVIIVVP